MKTLNRNIKHFQFGDLLLQYTGNKPEIITLNNKKVVRFAELDSYFTEIKSNKRFVFCSNDLTPEAQKNVLIDEGLNRYSPNGMKLVRPMKAYLIQPYEDPDSNEFNKQPPEGELLLSESIQEYLESIKNDWLIHKKILNPFNPNRPKPKQFIFGRYAFFYFWKEPEVIYINDKPTIKILDLLEDNCPQFDIRTAFIDIRSRMIHLLTGEKLDWSLCIGPTHIDDYIVKGNLILLSEERYDYDIEDFRMDENLHILDSHGRRIYDVLGNPVEIFVPYYLWNPAFDTISELIFMLTHNLYDYPCIKEAFDEFLRGE